MPYPLWKRIFDVAFSIFGVAATSVFFPFVALAILIESGFPVFVRLKRVSGGKIVEVWKFRTMIRGAHGMKKTLMKYNERIDGPLFKIKKDPRLTGVGKFLRKLRIDEFPQFFNVLLGELALVGPRPHEPQEIDAYPEEFKFISRARSGLTGLSQVSGASSLPFLKEIELDAEYLKNVSFRNDIKILFKTFFIFFFDPTGV